MLSRELKFRFSLIDGAAHGVEAPASFLERDQVGLWVPKKQLVGAGLQMTKTGIICYNKSKEQ